MARNVFGLAHVKSSGCGADVACWAHQSAAQHKQTVRPVSGIDGIDRKYILVNKQRTERKQKRRTGNAARCNVFATVGTWCAHPSIYA